MKYYELDFVEMDGNRVTRDFRHFTDENEAKQMFNDLKGNPEIVRVTRNELFKGNGQNYLGGSEERDYFVNSEPEMHRMFLNSRLGDKRFIAEPVTDYFGRRNRARKRFLQFEPVSENKLVKERNDAFSGYFSKTNLGRMIMDAEEILDSGMQNGEPLTNETEMLVRQELERLKQLYVDNHGYTGMMASADPDLKKKKAMKFLKSKKAYREGMSLESIYKDINEFDDKSMKAYGDAMKVALGSGEKSTSIEKIYMDMLKNELPSQDEVNNAFEKFERETHYLNNKPVGEWDATDMSNWKSILRKNGKLLMSVKESMARYRVSYTKKDSSKVSIDYISGLNAEDEFYELMNDDDIISAKVEYVGGDENWEEESTWTRGDDGKVDVKIN